MNLYDAQDPIFIQTLSLDLVTNFAYDEDDERDFFTQMLEHTKS